MAKFSSRLNDKIKTALEYNNWINAKQFLITKIYFHNNKIQTILDCQTKCVIHYFLFSSQFIFTYIVYIFLAHKYY